MNRKQRRAAQKKGNMGQDIAGALKQAIALQRSDQSDQAAQIYKQILKSAPDTHMAWNLLGMIQMDKNELAGANTCFAHALKHQPDNDMYLKNAGICYYGLGQYEKCAAILTRALEINPDNDAALSTRGVCNIALLNFEQAAQDLERAKTLNPGNAFTKLGLSELALLDGYQEEAKTGFIECLEDESVRNHALNSLLTNCHKVKTEDDAYYQTLLKELEGEASLSVVQRASTYFALGKVQKDLKHYDESFAAVTKAGDLLDRLYPYNYEQVSTKYELIKQYFTSDVIAKYKEHGLDSRRPVFIVGPPRSGTTLIEQIMHSHPDVYGVGETPQFQTGSAALCDLPRENEAEYPFRQKNIKPAESLTISQAAQNYLDFLDQTAPETDRIVNKAISNIYMLPMIRICFPHARIVYCYRNPLDSCISGFYQNFIPNQHTYSHNLRDLGRQYRLYFDMMGLWREREPEDIHVLNYEDVVEDTEGEARRLIDYLELPWDEACLSFYETKRQVATASVTQVRQPIYTSSLKRWKKFEKHLAPLIKELGPYAPEESLYILDKYSA